MTNPHEEFSDDHTPKAFLITFRSYGTWLHGDRRGSVDRFHNTYGTPRLPRNLQRERYERSLMAGPPVRLNAKQRAAIERGIRETCKIRKWALWAFNFNLHGIDLRSETGQEQQAGRCFFLLAFEKCCFLLLPAAAASWFSCLWIA
jgi:hypothetical protein